MRIISGNKEHQLGFFQGVKLVFKYKPYVWASLTFLCLTLAIQVIQGNVALFCTHTLKQGEEFSKFILVLLLVSIFSMPIWHMISVRFGKKKAYAAGMILMLPLIVSQMYLPAGVTWAYYIVMVVAGFGISVALLLPWSVLPDVLDLYMLEKNTRHDALFYSFYVFFNKLAAGLALAASQVALEFGGYVSGECKQPESVSDTLRYLMTPGPCVMVLLALGALYMYPIDEEKRKWIKAKDAVGRRSDADRGGRRNNDDGSYYHNYDDEDDDDFGENSNRRRDDRPRYDRRDGDNSFDDLSDDSRRPGRRSDDRRRRSRSPDEDRDFRRPSDRRRPRDNESIPDRRNDRRRSPPDRYYDDPKYSPRDRPRNYPRDRPRDSDRDRPRDSDRDRPREFDRDRPRDSERDRPRDSERDRPRDSERDRPRDSDRDRPRESDRDRPRDSDRDRPRDSDRDIPRDYPRDRSRDSDRDRPRDYPRRDRPRDFDRDRPRDFDRDRPRDYPRDRHRDSPRDRHGDRRHSPSDRRRDRRYSPDRRDDRSDDGRNSPRDRRPNGRHSPRNTDREPGDRSSNTYDQPWDIPLEKSPGETSKKYLPRNSQEKLVDSSPNSWDPLDNEYLEKPTERNGGVGGYKDENGHVTVDLGPGVYKPLSKTRPPPHHSRSKDNTPFPSQGSKLNEDQPPEDKDDDKKKIVYGEDENEERGNWSGKFDFILSMLGYAVGLGNVWRFPYLCYRNGGGAFLFPFLLMMVIIGLPLFYLEASLGQYSSCGAMTCWHFAPLFKGVGIAMVMVSAMTAIYYNMILGWALHYMFSSFTSDLPFASCDNDWNTEDCKLKLPEMDCGTDNTQSDDGRCLDENENEVGLWNKTLFTEVTGRQLQSPSEQYWERSVLDFSDGIEDFGQPKWDLVLVLLLAWVICFFCLIKGIKTTGKVVYFTAIFPYVVLIILFFRGVTLDNASIGVKYFITPNFERLGDANVWKDAANQIFFSMSIAGGGLITLSSYNRFHNNILRDSLIVALGDSFTCVLGGFVIFSYLGYMAGQLGVDIEDVAQDGAGLAFVVYPEAVSNLPPPTLWALLFFFMLLLLGLDSQFAMVETVLTGVLDQYPQYRPKKTLVIGIICIILFILGLPLTCPGGMYLLQLMDNYVGGMSLIIIGFVELIAVIYVYGFQRFCQDINLMTGSTWFLFWKVTWCVLSPLTIIFIFIFMFVDLKASTYDDYTYPAWADVIGWLFTLASILAIPIVMVIKMRNETEGKSLWQKLRLLCLPTVYWGPALKKHRALVDYVDGFQVDPYKGLQPRTTFVNPGFENKPEPVRQSEGLISLWASRISIISAWSRNTAVTAKSEKSGISFETNV